MGDLTFVNYVIGALELAAQSEMVREVLNIGGGHTISVDARIQNIEDLVGKASSCMVRRATKRRCSQYLGRCCKGTAVIIVEPQTDLQSGLKTYITLFLKIA